MAARRGSHTARPAGRLPDGGRAVPDGGHDEAGITRRSLVGLASGVLASGMIGTQAAVAGPAEPSDLVMMDAVTLAATLRSGRASSVEVMTAFLDHIDRLNPAANAIVALQDRGGLLAQARERDAQQARGDALGPLHGFPHAVKDLQPVKGIVSTRGSPIFRDFVPSVDSLMVERLRRAGAIFIGKTNTPEFGLGSHTYNPVYGATRNAYGPERSAGGSSGGAAVALALRMLPLADGSDFGGSLRNPAGWNNVLGFRTSFGRLPAAGDDVWQPTMSVGGPMARNVPDLALLLSVQAGYDDRAPLSMDGKVPPFGKLLDADFKGKRIAWAGDFGGFTPCGPGVLDTCRAALKTFETLGCMVEEAWPDYPLAAVWEALLTLRAWQSGGDLRALYADPAKRAQMKPAAIFEVESGAMLSAYDINAASRIRSDWYAAVRKFFRRYDYLVAPTAQIFPFDIKLDWPREIAGTPMKTYHEWMKGVFLVTMSGCPALAVPAGFGGEGLPIGLQIVAPNHAEAACLQLGHAFQQANDWTTKRLPPALARNAG